MRELRRCEALRANADHHQRISTSTRVCWLLQYHILCCLRVLRCAMPGGLPPLRHCPWPTRMLCCYSATGGSCDTTVAIFHVRPNKPCNASSLLPFAARLGRDFLLSAADVILRVGLKNLNSGEPTFVGRGVHTAIDIKSRKRTRYVRMVDLSGHLGIGSLFRFSWLPTPALLPGESDFLQHVADSAHAATVVSRIQPGRPVPDLRQLQLRAARRRADHRAIRCSGAADCRPSGGWALFVDATQTDVGSRAAKVSAVPSSALDAAQLRGGFCSR
ncbi:hypothetical protein HPB52_003490 [Rhipicephalus sanguineus]|uniref:Uncharacterized protein n=1 Tax=Rhipicephalus sanguineus TaxID=34632 RepID=A0A9D4T388_RHISA|nr:hypothetical protein HPB52_003490 [Rhipicephalus sanguineus]